MMGTQESMIECVGGRGVPEMWGLVKEKDMTRRASDTQQPLLGVWGRGGGDT